MRSISSFWRELTFAVRRLSADRWAAGAAILAVAIGTGLNTAVFAAVYGILLRPLPYADSERLARITVERRVDHTWLGVHRRNIDAWRRDTPGFERIAAYRPEDFVVRGAGEPRLVSTALVSEEFFDVLRLTPLRGRLWSSSSTDLGIAVVSQRFARGVLGQPDADVLGRQLTVGQAVVVIAAVLPGDAAFPSERTDIWLPIAAVPGVNIGARDGDGRHFGLIGRLAPSVTLAQAQGSAQQMLERLRPPAKPGEPPAIPGEPWTSVALVESLEEVLVRTVRPVVLTFAAGVGFVLLIVCANVATILVGRAVARQRELAIQRALGADATRLVFSMAAESFAIALAGSALGLLIALAAVRVLRSLDVGLVARANAVAIDWRVLLFACGLCIVVALVAAVLPARRGLAASMSALRTTSASAGRPARRARAALTVTQVALAVVVLAGAALLARTLASLLSIDIGVETRGAVSMRLMMTEGASFRATDREPIMRGLLERVRALPGVVHAGAGSSLPPAREQVELGIRLIDESKGIDEMIRASLVSITPGYIPALGARILRGRAFEERDLANPSAVALLSATTARKMFKSLDVVGKTLPMSMPSLVVKPTARPVVIGVVDDVKYYGLEKPAEAAIYVPWQSLPTGETFLIVRTAGDPAAMAGTLRRLVREVDPRLPVVDSQPLADVVDGLVADRRLRALLGGSIALLAFAVALVGLTGGLLHAVVERRRELAIRAALGATPRRTTRMILGEGALLTGAGVALGLLVAVSMGRALGGMLHGVGPSDPATLALVAALVAIVSLTACYLPARRAAKADPLELMRGE